MGCLGKVHLYSIEPKLPLISIDAIRAVVARNKKKLDAHAKKQEKDVVKVAKGNCRFVKIDGK